MPRDGTASAGPAGFRFIYIGVKRISIYLRTRQEPSKVPLGKMDLACGIFYHFLIILGNGV